MVEVAAKRSWGDRALIFRVAHSSRVLVIVSRDHGLLNPFLIREALIIGVSSRMRGPKTIKVFLELCRA
jgi:hypothetical protein